MDGIIEFLNTPLGQIIILIATALFFGKNPELVNRILELLKIQKPKAEAAQPKLITQEGTDVDLDKVTRADAYVAAENLITFFSGKEECKEGLEAAKKAGQCLFH